MSVTFNPALNVFENRKIDSSIDKITFSTVKPQTGIDDTGPYIFQIERGPDPIYLKNILLKVNCKLTLANGNNLADDSTVGPVNNVMHTMFSKVEVKVGDTVVTYNHSLYPYQAYMDDILFSDSAEKDNRLAMQGFILDTHSRLGVANPEAPVNNEGLKSRRDKYFGESRNAVLIGRLHADILKTEKCLLGDVALRITLHRSADAFCLMGVGNDFKLKINDLTLMIPRVTQGEAMRRSIESTLQKIPARYNIERTSMQTHMLASGSTVYNIPSLFRGNLPHTVVIAMVTNADRRAAYGRNPFNFDDFTLNKMVLSHNNVPVNYTNGLHIDYTALSATYTDGYLNMLWNSGRMGKGSIVSYEMFRGGYNIHCFKIAPQEDSMSDANALNTGVLDLSLSFTAALPNHVDVVVLAKYNDAITIDHARNVTVVGLQ